MEYLDLYLEKRPLKFGGADRDFGSSDYAIVGVPLDDTGSYRPGTRFAPLRVREASINIESNGYTIPEAFLESVPYSDLGDLGVTIGYTPGTLDRLRRVVGEIASEGKKPFLIGGEHTITLGALRGLRASSLCLAVFDAHFDLRSVYLENRLSHACVMRRVLEEVRPRRIAYIGVRAYSPEEILLSKTRSDIQYFTPLDVVRMGPVNVASSIMKSFEECKNIYVSFDIDGLDPSIAPGTGTPEPGGLDFLSAMRILSRLIDDRLVGFDIVEVNPLVDNHDVTSVVAAKIVQEALLLAYSADTRKRGRIK